MLDTASLISALRSNTGAAAEVLRLTLFRKITVLMDYKLACEYREVSVRPEQLAASGRSAADTSTLIAQIEALAEPVEILRTYRPLSEDPNDDMILELALNGEADAIVTNNIKHLRIMARRFGIDVLTPRELLVTIAKGE